MSGSRKKSDEPVSRRRVLQVTTVAATLGLGTTAAAEQAEQVEGTEEPDWHTLTLDGRRTTSRTDYSFTVSGDLDGLEGLDEDDQIDGSSAVGTVYAGIDPYRFTGVLEEYTLDGGDAVLLVDGERVASADEQWRTLTIDGQSTPSRTDYEFAVSGELEAREGIGRGDEIDGSSAEGFVRGGTDTYAFTGELVSYELQKGDGVLVVDGEQVARAKRPWRTLTVDGQGTASRTDYEFTIAGRLEKREGLGRDDEIEGSSAEGFVSGGLDGYYFVGTLKEYELEGGDGVLLVDGKRVASADEQGEEHRDEPEDDDGERDEHEGTGKSEQSETGEDKGKGEGGENGKDKKERKGKGKGKKKGNGKDHEEEDDEADEEDDDEDEEDEDYEEEQDEDDDENEEDDDEDE